MKAKRCPVWDKAEKAKAKAFAPPTTEEVEEYSQSIDYAISGDKFVNSYEQKGWMVGRNKMVSWKAAVRNWKCNGWGGKGTAAKKKTKLWPISGRCCSKEGCRLPAVYKSPGTYDFYYCHHHMPESVKAEYE